MKELTSRQHQLLAFIESYIADNGYPPAIREMAEHMGIRSTNGVNDHLKALERKGYLSRRPGLKSRALRLIERPAAAERVHPAAAEREQPAAETVAVPIVGRVAAGAPVLAEEHLEGRLELDRSLVGAGAEVFALRVQGESMIGRGILPDDIVFVRRQPSARDGQIVVALIDGEATVKTFRPAGDRIVFEPANPRWEPIEIHRSDFRQTDLLGVVTGVYRKL
jgi:repressor LexA